MDAKGLRFSTVGDPWRQEGEDVFVSPLNDKHNDEILIFDELMADGSIEVSVTPTHGLEQQNAREPKAGLIVFRYLNSRNYYFAGIGAWGKKYCIGRVIEGHSRLIEGVGDSGSLEKDREYRIAVKFSGSEIVLSEGGVPHVTVIEHEYSPGKRWGFRTWKTEARFAGARRPPKQPICFLIMPFAGFEQVYRVLKGTVESEAHGFRCERADTRSVTRPIIDDIMQFIAKADLIIVDLSGRNPNVYYEAGVAMALKKKVIHISQSVSDLTFDVKHLRTITYNFEFGGDRQLVEDLNRAIRETMSDPSAP